MSRHPKGLMRASLLLASALSLAAAQTTTLDIPKGLPASCTPLATLLGEYPPPTERGALDDALNDALAEGLQEFESRHQATATAAPSAPFDDAAFCGFVISTQVPSAAPSVTSSLSSYISAAGVWLEDHGLHAAESLLNGDCEAVVQPDDLVSVGALDFVIAFGRCYHLLGWDQTTSADAGVTTTTGASSAPTPTPSESGSVALVTPSPTGQATDVDVPAASSGSEGVAGAFWVLGVTLGITLLLA
ncbi:hypothetical protein SAMD00023353_9600290 [Rosellinia necatrix]|uniref:DUF7735 domain-containing protein n=1 Tax=Rosellinia necatrix TaxID=77044 RepID=A0A1W2TVL1_ROSNE|nr:hypothetical protein SAMD00023353_9600290 [Rosellinia necatrix]